VRLLVVALFAVLALAAASTAGAADRLTLRTSLGPVLEETDTRDLRARGSAPRGSKLLVRFYRGKKRIGSRRPRLEGTRYRAQKSIDRTGEYTVKVTATRRDGSKVRVDADLTYGPTAEAPAADDQPAAIRAR